MESSRTSFLVGEGGQYILSIGPSPNLVYATLLASEEMLISVFALANWAFGMGLESHLDVAKDELRQDEIDANFF